MKYRRQNFQFVILLLTATVWLCGCNHHCQKRLEICPGAESVTQAVSSLQNVPHGTIPLKAIGRCRAQFWADGKEYKESFNVKLWIDPIYNIRLQGDIFFNPKGIVIGSNKEQFWFSIKPEISSYYWGEWDKAALSKNLMINPEILLEAFGTVKIYDEREWSLKRQKEFDVLIQTSRTGRIVKKIYVYNCDYFVRKIEYFDNKEKIIAQIELNQYKKLLNGFFIPSKINIVNTYDRENQDVFKFVFNSIKHYEFSEKQKKALFKRPEPGGFKHVYKIVDGKITELQN